MSRHLSFGAAVLKRSPGRFLLLVLVLSLPFWAIGSITERHLLPGLPLSALQTFCPAVAAMILVYRQRRVEAVRQLLRRSFDLDWPTAWPWFVIALALMPATFGIAHLVGGGQIVSGGGVSLGMLLVLFAVFLIAALGEELGWSGYALDPLQTRWGALRAAVGLGLAWAAWHVVPLGQAGRSFAWIVWWSLFTVAARVLLVWLYNNAGRSVLVAAVCHATINVSWQALPGGGAHLDPRTTGLAAVLMAMLVTVVWGPRTLTRHRGTRVA